MRSTTSKMMIGLFVALIFCMAGCGGGGGSSSGNGATVIPTPIPTPILKPAIQLPKTGLNECYSETGRIIDCSTKGQTQDGAILAGVAWPSPRFSDNGNGLVTDNLTSLVWTKDANLMNTRDPNFAPEGSIYKGSVIWSDALDYIKKLNSEQYLGHNDWRLPNINELGSLLDLQRSLPALPIGHPFSNIQFSVATSPYWSSTTSTEHVRCIEMRIGEMEYVGKTGYGHAYVWPVRDAILADSTIPKTGQTTCWDSKGKVISCSGTGLDGDLQKGIAIPTQRFATTANSTVVDNLTGLMWTKSADTRGPTVCIPTANELSTTWQDALDYVSCLNSNSYLGYTDWRLPNRGELMSLVDISKSNPSLSDGHPFTGIKPNYYATSSSGSTYYITQAFWTSSSSIGSYYGASTFNYAWFVSINGGSWELDSKTENFNMNFNYMWPVRGGI